MRETRNFLKKQRDYGLRSCILFSETSAGETRERCTLGRIVFTPCKQTGSCLIILASAR